MTTQMMQFVIDKLGKENNLFMEEKWNDYFRNLSYKEKKTNFVIMIFGGKNMFPDYKEYVGSELIRMHELESKEFNKILVYYDPTKKVDYEYVCFEDLRDDKDSLYKENLRNHSR